MRVETKDSKDPAEAIVMTFDFAKLIASIDSVVISISVAKGVDPDVATMLLGSAQITGTEVKQIIRNGVADAIYLIRMDASLGSETYAEAVYLPVEVIG